MPEILFEFGIQEIIHEMEKQKNQDSKEMRVGGKFCQEIIYAFQIICTYFSTYMKYFLLEGTFNFMVEAFKDGFVFKSCN